MRHLLLLIGLSIILACQGDKKLFLPAPESNKYPENRLSWGFIDKTGQVIISPRFDEVGDFREGLAPFRKGFLWGYINKTGQTVIRPQYLIAEAFYSGIAKVTTVEGHTFFINQDGSSAFPFYCENGGNFSESLARIQCDGIIGFMNAKGELVIPPRFQDTYGFLKGYCVVLSGKKFGIIDSLGGYALRPNWDFIYTNDEDDSGIYLIRKKGKTGYFNPSSQYYIRPIYSSGKPFYQHHAVVEQDSLFGVINAFGQWVVQPIFRNLAILGDNRFAIRYDKEYFMIDSSGLQHGEGFRQINRFYCNRAAAKIDHKWGFIDTSGHFLIPPKYDLVWDYRDSIAKVATDEGIMHIDAFGRQVIPPIQADIRNFQEGLARIGVPK